MKRLNIIKFISFIFCFLFMVATPLTVRADETTFALDDYLSSSDGEIASNISKLNKTKSELQSLKEKCQKNLIDSKFMHTGGNMYNYQGDTLDFSILPAAEWLLSDGEHDVESYALYAGDPVKVTVKNTLINKAIGEIDSAIADIDSSVRQYNRMCSLDWDVSNVFPVEVTSNNYFDRNSYHTIDKVLYGETSAERVEAGTAERKKGSIEKWIAEPFGYGAQMLYEWMEGWNINITIDGLVYGRMASSFTGTADFTHFGLETNNPYGIVGSTVFYVLRRILLSVIPVIVLVLLIRNLFRNGKQRALLKEDLQNAFFVLVMLFVAPYVINWMLYFRDGVIRYVSKGMAAIFTGVGIGNISIGGTVYQSLYASWRQSETLLDAMLLLASVGSGFFYLANYLKIAILLTGCFAILPIILFKAIWDKKIIKDWWNIYFPNLCVPLVDLVLLQIPSVVLIMYKKLAGGGGSFVLGIVLMLIIWSLIPIRERIVKLLGFDGMGGRAGGGMMAALMLMARTAGRNSDRRGGVSTDTLKPGANPEEQIADAQARGAAMQEAREDFGLGGSPEDGMDTGADIGRTGDSRADEFLGGEDVPPEIGGDAGEGGMAAGEDVPEGADFGDAADVSVDAGAGGMPEVGDSVPGEAAEPVVPSVEPISGDSGESAGRGLPVGGDVLGDADVREAADAPVGAGNITAGADGGVPGDSVLRSLPEEEAKFVQSLDSDDRARYMNLRQMDNCNVKIAENEAAIRNSGYSEAADSRAQANVERCERAEAEAKMQRDVTGTRLSGLENQVSEQQAVRDRALAELESARGAQHESRAQQNYDRASGELLKRETARDAAKVEHESAKSAYEAAHNKTEAARASAEEKHRGADEHSRMTRENVQLKAEAAECAKKEQQFAHVREVGGMSSKTYKDAASYRHATRVEQAQRQLANYSNFDTKRYEGVLTPAEREQFYRERAMAERRKAAGMAAASVAKGTVKVAAAVTVASTLAYGGPGAMAGGAMVTSGVLHGAHSRVRSAGDAVSDVTRPLPGKTPPAPKPTKPVAKSVRPVPKTDGRGAKKPEPTKLDMEKKYAQKMSENAGKAVPRKKESGDKK